VEPQTWIVEGRLFTLSSDCSSSTFNNNSLQICPFNLFSSIQSLLAFIEIDWSSSSNSSGSTGSKENILQTVVLDRRLEYGKQPTAQSLSTLVYQSCRIKNVVLESPSPHMYHYLPHLRGVIASALKCDEIDILSILILTWLRNGKKGWTRQAG
jgi:hypothetical protein